MYAFKSFSMQYTFSFAEMLSMEVVFVVCLCGSSCSLPFRIDNIRYSNEDESVSVGRRERSVIPVCYGTIVEKPMNSSLQDKIL